MQGASAKSLGDVLARTREVLSGGPDARALGEELFALAATLDGGHSLRRALTEPAVPAEAKARLLRSLVEGKVSDATVQVAEVAVGRRWSHSRDLADALEQASVAAHVARADADGRLDAVEDDLFRFGRIVEADPRLREALSDAAAPVETRRQLVRDLVAGKVDETTVALLEQAVTGRHRSLTSALTLYQRVAAERRHSMVATVWVAAQLSADHKERLTRALSRQHGCAMHLNVIVDPQVLGGVRVAVGDEVLDSTVEARLKQAQRRLER